MSVTGMKITLEVFCDFLIPQSDVSLAIINDGSQFGISGQVVHENVHTFAALDEIDNLLLVILLVEGTDSVVDGLAENGGQTVAHSGVSK